MSSLTHQVGGDHYSNMGYQPVAFATKMRYNFIQGSILKYASRYKRKNGKEDLEKAMHFCQIGAELSPTNFAVDNLVETHKFIKKNNMDDVMESLVTALTSQFWLGVSHNILLLSENIK